MIDFEADAMRWRFYRKHFSHLVIGLLSSERKGDSLADLSEDRADVLIDRAMRDAQQHNQQP